MILVIEIVLVIAAWIRGWRWWVLFPFGLGLAISFHAIGNPGKIIGPFTVANIVDMVVIIVLGVMTAVKPPK